MTIYGVDVNPIYQAKFNFQMAARDGYDFAFVTASQGDTGPQDGFADYFKRAKAMNVVGAYHFLDSTMSGRDQADMFVNVLRRNGGTDGVALAVDFEPYRDPKGSWNFDPTNGNLNSFITRLKSLTGRHPVIAYSTYNYWQEGTPTGNPAEYGIDSMWDASVWEVDERIESPKKFYINQWRPWYNRNNRPGKRLEFQSVETPFRQFTWGGQVGGLYVDTDAFEGSLEELKKLTRS